MKLPASFFFFGLALLIWAASASISSYLISPEEGVKQTASKSSAFSEEIMLLQKKSQEHPKDASILMELASAFEKESMQGGEKRGELLMAAAGSYKQATMIAPESAEALLQYARFCHRYGILDKAEELYKKYLALAPEDLASKTDYALVLLQQSRGGESKEVLEEIVKSNPKYFGTRLALVYVYSELGEKKKAEETAKIASELAPDEEGKRQLEIALKRAAEAPKTAPSKTLSPAARVQEFFKAHKIIGPKLSRITWPKANLARVEVKDFPAESMPPAAKEAFFKNIKAHLAGIPERIEIEIFDSSSNTVQLRFDAGGKDKS